MCEEDTYETKSLGSGAFTTGWRLCRTEESTSGSSQWKNSDKTLEILENKRPIWIGRYEDKSETWDQMATVESEEKDMKLLMARGLGKAPILASNLVEAGVPWGLDGKEKEGSER